MTGRMILAMALLGLLAKTGDARSPARVPAEPRVDGPFTHENLSIWVVSGEGSDARRFITLDEGLRAKTVAIRERGARSGEDRAQVNELEIENASGDWLFLQAGDVVSGGKQDRTIAIDVAIPPHSGPRPIAAFCVEHGRWTPKAAGMEFSASPAIAGSNAMKRNIQEHRDQQKVWAEVARQEARAAAALADAGAPPTTLSSTGTYSAIVENPRIVSNRTEYVAALLPRIEKIRGATGLVVAIGGRITAADVYGSPALFRKLARKLLDSYAQEAVLAGKSASAAGELPDTAAAREFLRNVAAGGAEEEVADSVFRTTRRNDEAVVFEYAQPGKDKADRILLHRNSVKN